MKKDEWTLERSRAVVSCLVTGDPALNEARKGVRAAVQSLQKGIPFDAHFIEHDEDTGLPIYRWIEERYWIYFAVNEERKWIKVLAVESTTVE